MKPLSEMSDMRGRVAAITGGGGNLGRAFAKVLAEVGAHVILIDRDAVVMEAVREDLGGSHRIDCLELNLESEEERGALPQRLLKLTGRLDCLINNAGFVGDSNLSGWATAFNEQSIETWRRALEVNLTAPFHLSQLLFPMLSEKGTGSIINISSIYGILGPDMSIYDGTGMGNPAAYAASKGGLIQLTRWLATTLAPKVRVNCVSPGGLARNQPESFVERYEQRTPMARMGCEEDFTGVIAFLASDQSSWMTGQNIVIDGGWSVW